ncbi:rhythmically expressed gene 2 protein [Cydia pomonella]|uniref:rhythmically expressed gene 2 protein n=1 Tax=Cydia pomonella TaxID=82600 RepID=UPI002ADD7897|nr:rhythmically expressed gene 2 protein [Cydia pomonella]
MSLRGIKLVTLDATNTILKFRLPPWQHYAAVAQDFGFTVDAQLVKKQMLGGFKSMSEDHPNFGKNTIAWEEWWRKLVKASFTGLLPSSADVNRIANRLIEDFKTTKCWKRADGGEKLLNLLRDKGISVGVISNYDPRLREVLQNINLGNHFDFIVTSYDVGFSKPDKKIFSHAMQLDKSLSPVQCLHIGDDLKKDYEGARAAGWHAVLVAAESAETPPAEKHVFKDLNALNLAIQRDELVL